MESSYQRKSNTYSSVSSMSTFTFRPAGIITRSDSPTRVHLRGPVSKSSSVQLSSPRRSMAHTQKKTCMCSPTTHRGSFRCSLHKNANNTRNQQTVSYQSHRLNARRSEMTKSLVRIGTVERELVKRALSALIRPSSRQQTRRGEFQPKRSRLSFMSKAHDF